MAVRRIIYLLTWTGCMVFFCAYRQWLGWYALVAVTALPVFSLLVSLPAMLSARLELGLPEAVTVGIPAQLKLRCRSAMPTPPWRCKVLMERPLTEERWMLKGSSPLPTEHCGTLTFTFKKARVCDYLGLFSLPLKCPSGKQLPVRPERLSMEAGPEENRHLNLGWKPKPGGGFSENHELRLYRPGDNIQQIHWKLSGKTGKLILRESMEPARQQVLLRLELSGEPAALDQKLGNFLWFGEQLLEKDIHFEAQCRTGSGRVCRKVTCVQELEQVLDELLACPRAESGSIHDWPPAQGRQYTIGGGADEA